MLEASSYSYLTHCRVLSCPHRPSSTRWPTPCSSPTASTRWVGAKTSEPVGLGCQPLSCCHHTRRRGSMNSRADVDRLCIRGDVFEQNVLQTAFLIVKEEGLSALYKGE